MSSSVKSRLFGNTFAENIGLKKELFLYLLLTPLGLSIAMHQDLVEYGLSVKLLLDWIPEFIIFYCIFLVASFIGHTHLTLVLVEDKIVKELGIGLLKKEISINDITKIYTYSKKQSGYTVKLMFSDGTYRKLSIREINEFIQMLKHLNSEIIVENA